MARKEITYTVEDEGRDKAKQFKLREMPASQAERWAIRTFLAMGKAGVEIPDHLAEQGMAGIAAIGLMNMTRIPFADADPLLAEMMDCVTRIEPAITRPLIEDDIEEVSTRLKLRRAVLDLHLGFFALAGHSTSGSVQPAAQGNSLNIKMPRKQ